ncbi:MAG: carboxypeptidase-like regulatory domain-containing protein, partial [bacterium]
MTTAAIEGTVSATDGSPVAAATVQLTNVADGRRWEIATRPDGGFLLEGVAVGTYRVEVGAVGFTTVSREQIVLTLGQRLVADFTLWPATLELPPVTVQGTRDPLLDPGRTGPADLIPRSVLATVPNLGRTFVNLTLLSPQVAFSVRTPAIATASGIAFDGQNRVYN